MHSFLRVIRWANILIIPLVMFAMRYALLKPMLRVTGIEIAMPGIHFLIMVAATMLLGAAGYIINDYFDRKIDLINHPKRVVIGQKMSRFTAITLHFAFNLLAVALGTYLAYKLHLWWVALVYFFVAGVFWFYSTTYKRMFLVGNIVVSIMTALVPLQVLFFEYTYQLKSGIELVGDGGVQKNLYVIGVWVIAFSFFAFMSNFIREIIKDFEDIRGDMRYGRRSVPIVLGLLKAKWLVQILTAITIFFIFIGAHKVVYDWQSWIYIIAFVITPLIIHMILVHRASLKQHFHTTSLIMKGIMFTGLFYAILVWYNVNQISL